MELGPPSEWEEAPVIEVEPDLPSGRISIVTVEDSAINYVLYVQLWGAKSPPVVLARIHVGMCKSHDNTVRILHNVTFLRYK